MITNSFKLILFLYCINSESLTNGFTIYQSISKSIDNLKCSIKLSITESMDNRLRLIAGEIISNSPAVILSLDERNNFRFSGCILNVLIINDVFDLRKYFSGNSIEETGKYLVITSNSELTNEFYELREFQDQIYTMFVLANEHDMITYYFDRFNTYMPRVNQIIRVNSSDIAKLFHYKVLSDNFHQNDITIGYLPFGAKAYRGTDNKLYGVDIESYKYISTIFNFK